MLPALAAPALLPGAPTPADPGAELLADFLAGLKPSTRRAYVFDLGDFAAALMAPSTAHAVGSLLALAGGDANRLVMAYRNTLLSRGLATATVGRRLAALRSVTKLARMLGLIAWSIEVKAPPVEARRDVRGPDRVEWRSVWKAARDAGDTMKGRRDRALLALLYDLALRRNEVVTLDLADYHADGGTVLVLRKGKTEKVRLTLPGPTRKALADWIHVRGIAPGPLFFRLDRGNRQRPEDASRLTGDGLRVIAGSLGRRAKLDRPLRPHGLRHSAITAALDAGVDIRDVRKYSGHSRLDTVLKYDDARDDVAARVARKVAGDRK
jgi:integrase/recombinase XerC